MKIIKLFPGIVLSIAIAALACWLESLLPIHLIGSAVIAMFIGMFLNQFVRKTDVFASGLKFTSKKILKFAHMEDRGNIQRQAQQDDGKLQNLLRCEFQSGSKHIRFADKLIQKHTDEHGDNSRADQMDGQQTFQPAGKSRNRYRQYNAGKQLNDLHRTTPYFYIRA